MRRFPSQGPGISAAAFNSNVCLIKVKNLLTLEICIVSVSFHRRCHQSLGWELSTAVCSWLVCPSSWPAAGAPSPPRPSSPLSASSSASPRCYVSEVMLKNFLCQPFYRRKVTAADHKETLVLCPLSKPLCHLTARGLFQYLNNAVWGLFCFNTTCLKCQQFLFCVEIIFLFLRV